MQEYAQTNYASYLEFSFFKCHVGNSQLAAPEKYAKEYFTLPYIIPTYLNFLRKYLNS